MATCLLNNPLDEDEIRYILGIARDWALTNGITYLKLISLLKWTLFWCLHSLYHVQACMMICMNSCAHIKNPKHWQPYQCLDTQLKLSLIHI